MDLMDVKYRLLFLSDWHIGSGTGIPGIVDNGVLKNSQNLPVINGKTIKGITRDALEDLLVLTGAAAPAHILSDIFGEKGDKVGQAVFHHPRICPDENERNSAEFKNFSTYFKEHALGDIRFHTSIDKETGTAQKGRLFSEEVSDRGFEFSGTIRVADHYAGYIIAALRFITKIGGKRRRGLGQCELEILYPEDYETYIREICP
ncbi:MAG: RAMP superfamily CRISPR-associated protein [Candidatus Aminicenantes bacterium]|nr:RAMP superfamily CRISPR-associated protein [Candidatus Aminicenantes bacterium]